MVIGMVGAFGNMNLTSSNFCLRLQFSAKETQPAPLSPKPCAMMTVAVCRFTAGMIRGAAITRHRCSKVSGYHAVPWSCIVETVAEETVSVQSSTLTLPKGCAVTP
jgi:hypothetical protein